MIGAPGSDTHKSPDNGFIRSFARTSLPDVKQAVAFLNNHMIAVSKLHIAKWFRNLDTNANFFLLRSSINITAPMYF